MQGLLFGPCCLLLFTLVIFATGLSQPPTNPSPHHTSKKITQSSPTSQPTSPTNSPQIPNSSPPTSDDNVAIIIGVVVGGLILIIIIVVLVVCIVNFANKDTKRDKEAMNELKEMRSGYNLKTPVMDSNMPGDSQLSSTSMVTTSSVPSVIVVPKKTLQPNTIRTQSNERPYTTRPYTTRKTYITGRPPTARRSHTTRSQSARRPHTTRRKHKERNMVASSGAIRQHAPSDISRTHRRRKWRRQKLAPSVGEIVSNDFENKHFRRHRSAPARQRQTISSPGHTITHRRQRSFSLDARHSRRKRLPPKSETPSPSKPRKITKRELNELKDIFNQWDLDKDGLLTRKETIKLLKEVFGLQDADIFVLGIFTQPQSTVTFRQFASKIYHQIYVAQKLYFEPQTEADRLQRKKSRQASDRLAQQGFNEVASRIHDYGGSPQ